MNKAIYFDMDGTLADLYNVPDWLRKLRAEDASPYAVAAPMVDMVALAEICKRLQAEGYTIGVISWLARFSSRRYNAAVRKAKREWLNQFFPIELDELHFVKYGAPKHLIAKVRQSWLVDDNKEVLTSWQKYGGSGIEAQGNILEALTKLLS